MYYKLKAKFKSIFEYICEIRNIYTLMMQGRNDFNQSLPPVTLNLLIINALFLLATFVFQRTNLDINLYGLLGLHYFGASDFNLVQMVTYMFLHADFSHLFFNMFSLFMFGRTLETVWGGKRFLTYYMATGIGAAIVQQIVWWFQVQEVVAQYGSGVGFMMQELPIFLNRAFLTVGASGAVFGILLAFGMLFPNANLFLMFIPVPIKAKYFVIGYGLIELFMGVSNFSGDNVAHFAHLGGMIFGFILIKYWKKKDQDNGRYFY